MTHDSGGRLGVWSEVSRRLFLCLKLGKKMASSRTHSRADTVAHRRVGVSLSSAESLELSQQPSYLTHPQSGL